jgi:hypothetical protein
MLNSFSFPVSAFSSRCANCSKRENEAREGRISGRLIRQCHPEMPGVSARGNVTDHAVTHGRKK